MKKVNTLAGVLLLASSAFPQQAPVPIVPPAPQAPLQIPDPHYVSVSASIEVEAPADTVWARVGGFCDIGRWSPEDDGSACTYLSGDGGVGTVRSTANEVLVGVTRFSYTYAQAPIENEPYNLYHGTLQVVPLTATTSRLDYVLFFDTSMLPGAVAREKYGKSQDTSLRQQLKAAKIIGEGGTLPATPAGPRAPVAPPASYLSPQPHYVVIPLQVDVHAPAEAVWSRIGHFCDIGKLGAIGYPTCMITSGLEGEYGVVRNIGHEVLVGKTKYSYTYAQQMRASGFYLLYHGTIEARPVTAATSTLYWTLVYDNSNLADDAAKEKDIAKRRTRFLGMMQNVKILSEGGTLPSDEASSAK